MRKKILFAISAFFLLMILFFSGNSREIEKDFKIRGDSFIEGLKIVHKRDDKNIWTLNARRADIAEDDNKAELSDISISLEDRGLIIRSGSGLYDIGKRNLTLNGRITADAQDYTIITDSANLDDSTGQIKTMGNVRLESKKFNVEGLGMEATSDHKVRIFKNVKAIFYH